jgi:hypothetical protein
MALVPTYTEKKNKTKVVEDLNWKFDAIYRTYLCNQVILRRVTIYAVSSFSEI